MSWRDNYDVEILDRDGDAFPVTIKSVLPTGPNNEPQVVQALRVDSVSSNISKVGKDGDPFAVVLMTFGNAALFAPFDLDGFDEFIDGLKKIREEMANPRDDQWFSVREAEQELEEEEEEEPVE